MLIRVAQPADLEALTAFYTRMTHVINERTHQANPNHRIYPSAELIGEAIDAGQQFVGVEDGRIAVACIVNGSCDPSYHTVRWQAEAGPDEFWVIHALRVLPEYQGRGFAKQMLRHLIETAPDRGVRSIRLDILEGYEVARLYENLGFGYVDTVEILYEDIGSYQRFRLLEKVIDK